MAYIYARQEAHEIDSTLKALNDAANTANNGKVAYIKDGVLTFDTYTNLFTITEFDED